ncbi:MAG: DUF1667 domain-containing protein [Erysipelotrichaceae bacterium]|nr:DUF1667 domain-containing protein [Erysipelotrichaceae bacterium]
MATDMTCIICPRGCHLHIDDDLNVTGNSCPRGAAYARQEVTDPRRTLTTTVRCHSELLEVCPVKTIAPIPKGKVFDAMKEVNEVVLVPPVHIGDVVKANIAGAGIDLVATRDIEK